MNVSTLRWIRTHDTWEASVLQTSAAQRGISWCDLTRPLRSRSFNFPIASTKRPKAPLDKTGAFVACAFLLLLPHRHLSFYVAAEPVKDEITNHVQVTKSEHSLVRTHHGRGMPSGSLGIGFSFRNRVFFSPERGVSREIAPTSYRRPRKQWWSLVFEDGTSKWLILVVQKKNRILPTYLWQQTVVQSLHSGEYSHPLVSVLANRTGLAFPWKY